MPPPDTDGNPDGMGMVTVRAMAAVRGLFKVTPDVGEPVIMPPDVIVQFGVSSGRAFTAERWAELQREALALLCYRQLLALLSRRAHTQWEMMRKLRQRLYDPELARASIAKAVDLGLMDDAAFARQFVREKLAYAKVGRRKIVSDLRARGVAGPVVEAVMREFVEAANDDGEDLATQEYEQALKLAERKWLSLQREEDPRKRRHKLLAYLAGRGYPGSVAYKVLDALRRQDQATADGEDEDED